MNTESLEIRRRLGLFSERPVAVTDAPTRAGRRERIIGRIEEALAEGPSVRRTWFGKPWVGWTGALALAAGAAVVAGQWTRVHWSEQPAPSALRSVTLHGNVLCRYGATDAWGACEAQAILAGASLKTLDRSMAELESAAGVQLELRSDGNLVLSAIEPARHDSSVTLRRGMLAVRVPPLPAGTQFSVITPTATVVVHGTAFSVEVTEAAEGQRRTCVRVTEGTVAVRHAQGEQLVSAAGNWGCEGDMRSAALAQADTVPVGNELNPPQAASTARLPAGSTSPERSTLAAEAHLLQKALGAERRGDLALAERTLASLLNAFPNSVVAPEARAARERIRRRQQDQRR